MSAPEGFDGVYPCRQHPEREATPPIALRLCQECHEDAKRNYAEQHEREYPFRFQDEQSPDGRYIYKEMRGYYKPRREEI